MVSEDDFAGGKVIHLNHPGFSTIFIHEVFKALESYSAIPVAAVFALPIQGVKGSDIAILEPYDHFGEGMHLVSPTLWWLIHTGSGFKVLDQGFDRNVFHELLVMKAGDHCALICRRDQHLQ